ncbi:MAG: GTP pyrophosphokinase family protein [Lachnospiraceae bacterium]|nr:GTP pyrophosphokinase family protein [Lachnospiraceae bacterium]
MNTTNTPSDRITESSIYGSHLPEMETIKEELLLWIEDFRKEITKQTGSDPVEHSLGRIKSDESMRDKCIRKGLPFTVDSVLHEIHDAIGIRVVCAFLSDVYTIRDRIVKFPGCSIHAEKDYIRHAKPNGYRSYHLILNVRGYFVEVQIRTISMDTWAALEHHLKYKKHVSGNDSLIVSELKRCADELASTDISMQTIRDMIFEEGDQTGT